jgi:hypothetical protein
MKHVYRTLVTQSVGTIDSKATFTCTESATAERFRYTPLQPALRKALIPFSFSLPSQL